MSYRNGKDVFPPALLKEIQRYVQGTSVYIPGDGMRRRDSGLGARNDEIRRRYAGGEPVRKLSEEYYLSPQAVYKIIAEGKGDA